MQFLVINQHGENRGDEAAMCDMLDSFIEKVSQVKFTVLYQHRDSNIKPKHSYITQSYPIVLSIKSYLVLFLYCLLKRLGFDIPGILCPVGRQIVESYRAATLVISAPGGPYFGDYYASHEIIHWLYIYLGYLFNKPLVLYASSAGPYYHILLNPIRRWLFKKFHRIMIRDTQSAQYLNQLCKGKFSIELTADSALQQKISPHCKKHFLSDRHDLNLNKRPLVAVALNDYQFQNRANKTILIANYQSSVITILKHLLDKHNAYLLFFPQLYGQAHDDSTFLRRIGEKLDSTHAWELIRVESALKQRKLIAMCDMHFVSRYHPAVFAFSASVPGVSLCYEHKMRGILHDLELDYLGFDICCINPQAVNDTLDHVMLYNDKLKQKIEQKLPQLRQKAARSTKLTLELLTHL